MKYGARNQLEGTVKTIKKGSVMSQVDIEIGGQALVSSVMTLDTLEAMGLREGDRVKAMIKAVNVTLVKE